MNRLQTRVDRLESKVGTSDDTGEPAIIVRYVEPAGAGTREGSLIGLRCANGEIVLRHAGEASESFVERVAAEERERVPKDCRVVLYEVYKGDQS